MTSTPNVSVVIPVGPSDANRRWLNEAVTSVLNQTYRPAPDIVIVDDMAEMDPYMVPRDLLTYWRSPWYLGVAHAFNIGIMVAPSDLVFMLGSDDSLEPDCIAECIETYKERRDRDGYYYVGVRYTDTNELQEVPCHAAMVTKSLWRLTGGFPIESASGSPDAALISIIIGNYPRAGRHWQVANGRPLYNYRRHSESFSGRAPYWQGIIMETRDHVTREWYPRQSHD